MSEDEKIVFKTLVKEAVIEGMSDVFGTNMKDPDKRSEVIKDLAFLREQRINHKENKRKAMLAGIALVVVALGQYVMTAVGIGK